MSVYVDMPFVWEATDPQTKRVGARHGHQWCHMWADSLEELHKMAKTIGMKEEWFQNKPRLPHYDLIPTKRAKAIKLGAIEMSLREHFVRVRALEKALMVTE